LTGPERGEPGAVVAAPRPRQSRALGVVGAVAIVVAILAVATVGAILWLGPPPRPTGPAGVPPFAPLGPRPPNAAAVGAAEPAAESDAAVDAHLGSDAREQAGEAGPREPGLREPRGQPAAEEPRPPASRLKQGVLRTKARIERARWATCVGLCERTARQCERQAGGPTARHLCIEQRSACIEGCSR
jgi:hypothetical protein